MNRKFFLFAVVAMILVAIAACSKDEPGVEVIVPQQEQMDSYRVSVDEALRSAETILRAGDRDTRSDARRVKSTELYVAKPATRSNENTEVSFYLINYEDNAGYALVSTDERTTPVYMYAEDGNITTEAFEEVPPLAIFMEEAVANYEAEVANYDEPEDIYFPPGMDGLMGKIDGILCYINNDTIQSSKRLPRLTSWRQTAPYNDLCYNKLLGCVPVALGQIMAYYRLPESYYGYSFNWTAMLHSNIISCVDEVGAQHIKRLLERIGRAAGIRYEESNCDSGSSNQKALEALMAFGYDGTLYDGFVSYYAISDLENNRPVYSSGFHYQTGEGHAWMIIGYNRTQYVTRYHFTEPPYNLYKTETKGEILYFEHNLGTGGGETAFLLEPTELEYRNNRGLIYNIHPSND